MTVQFVLNWDGLGSPTWVDYTAFVDVTTFRRNKSLDEENNPRKSVSSEIEAYGDAFKAIKANLIDSSDRYSNFYVVRIVDTDCGDTEFLFKIEDKQLRWCDNGECKILLTLIEYSPILDCIKRTTIANNASGNFQQDPVSGNIHPRFRYCDVVKPTFMYGMLITFINGVVLFINSLNVMLITITGIIVWIVNQLGGNVSIPQIGYGFTEGLLGCNRAHPAPFIRTYIDNVCAICGITVNDVTAPILYSALEDNGLYDNQYYWACLATGYTTKGVKVDTSRGYIPSNQPSWTLEKLVSILKDVFNARWFMKNGTELYFDRKDKIGTSLWGVGFYGLYMEVGSDGENLLGDICYTYNGQGKPKRLIYNYGTDPSDNIGNELLRRFRGTYEDPTTNANYHETIEKTMIELGAACCVLDGKDSLYDLNIVKALQGLTQTVNDYKGCLKTQGDTFALPKLLIWDSTSTLDDARVSGNDYTIYNSSGANLDAFKDDDAVSFPIDDADCKNYNYPFSFDPDAQDVSSSGYRNLWYFHQIDVPSPSKRSNIDVEFKLQYCCQYNSLELYMTILLPDTITEAEIYSLDFDHEKREITVKATLK